MGLSALASAGVELRRLIVPDLDALPWQASRTGGVLLPGIYVVAEPAGAAPWAGTICTNWRHAAGAPEVSCGFCGIGRA